VLVCDKPLQPCLMLTSKVRGYLNEAPFMGLHSRVRSVLAANIRLVCRYLSEAYNSKLSKYRQMSVSKVRAYPSETPFERGIQG
jgi:hypothetical protein